MIDTNKTKITVNGRDIYSGLFNKPQEPQEPVVGNAEEAANLIFYMSAQLAKVVSFDLSKTVCCINVEAWREEGKPNIIPLSMLNDFVKSKQDANGNIGFDLVARIRKSDPTIIYLEVADD